MSGLYFDEHMHRDIARALVKQGIPVTMAVDVGMTAKSDEEHLAYATAQELIMVSFDHPFAGRTMNRDDFFGLICLPYDYMQDMGAAIEQLADYAQLFEADRDHGLVFWIK
jgi:predicted nuclease of predicted toxin-antitoxin system